MEHDRLVAFMEKLKMVRDAIAHLETNRKVTATTIRRKVEFQQLEKAYMKAILGVGTKYNCYRVYVELEGNAGHFNELYFTDVTKEDIELLLPYRVKGKIMESRIEPIELGKLV